MGKKPDAAANGQYVWHEISDLFHEVLNYFYEKRDREKAFAPALHLLRLLDKHDPHAEALLGMSGRWLVAELDGDIEEAVRWKEKEIAALRSQIEKGLLKTGALESDEFSDRLDLLACSYLTLEHYDKALAALAESEAYCKDHGLPFDGKDIRADVKRAMKQAATKKQRTAKAS